MNLNFGCVDTECYAFNPCDSDNPSRILHLAMVRKDVTLDTTDATTLFDSLMDAELDGTAHIIRNITGEKPRPETTEGQGYGKQTIKVLNSNHTINFLDQHVVENLGFYNTIRFSSGQFDLWYFTDQLAWNVSGQQVTFYGDPVYTNGPTDLIYGEGTIKWAQKGNPLPFPEEFDTDALGDGLFYIIGGDASNGTMSVVSGEEEEFNLTAQLSQYVANSCNLLWSFKNPIDTDIAGIVIEEETGIITVSASSTGTYEFTVVVENDCGGCVKGEKTYTLTVTPAP